MAGTATKIKGSGIQSGELVYINIDLVGENGIIESNDARRLTVTV